MDHLHTVLIPAQNQDGITAQENTRRAIQGEGFKKFQMLLYFNDSMTRMTDMTFEHKTHFKVVKCCLKLKN